MNSMFKYNKKNVHDIQVYDSIIRLWSQEGRGDIRMIKKSFQSLLKTSFVYPYIALMPDYHPGEKSMIGSVIPTENILLPTVIGNDIGCGMIAVKLPILLSDISLDMYNLRLLIQKKVPTGSTYNNQISARVIQKNIIGNVDNISFISRRNRNKINRQFGSLGGGNHFLEVQTDEDGYIWIMIHSGSRYLGVLVREYYVNAGKNQSDIDSKIYSRIPYIINKSETGINYLNDMMVTINYAKESRKEMMLRVIDVLSRLLPLFKNMSYDKLLKNTIDVPHNYISKEKYFGKPLIIHRKGAIRVRDNEKGIIPGSMGTKSYIVQGKGNKYSFCSCSHGAGRSMSRGDAFRKISNKAFQKSMNGIIYDETMNIKDEAPHAYKDIDKVMRGQKDIVRILNKLKPLISIKGN